MTASSPQISPKSASSALTWAAHQAVLAKGGVGPAERQELAVAIRQIHSSNALNLHEQAQTLRALFQACGVVLRLSNPDLDCPDKHKNLTRALEEMTQAKEAHLHALAGKRPDFSQSGQRKLKSSWPNNSRIDPLIGVANMGRD